MPTVLELLNGGAKVNSDPEQNNKVSVSALLKTMGQPPQPKPTPMLDALKAMGQPQAAAQTQPEAQPKPTVLGLLKKIGEGTVDRADAAIVGAGRGFASLYNLPSSAINVGSKAVGSKFRVPYIPRFSESEEDKKQAEAHPNYAFAGAFLPGAKGLWKGGYSLLKGGFKSAVPSVARNFAAGGAAGAAATPLLNEQEAHFNGNDDAPIDFSGIGENAGMGAVLGGVAGGAGVKRKFIEPTETERVAAPKEHVDTARAAMESAAQEQAANAQPAAGEAAAAAEGVAESPAQAAASKPATDAGANPAGASPAAVSKKPNIIELLKAAGNGDVGQAYGLSPQRFSVRQLLQESAADRAMRKAGQESLKNKIFSQEELQALHGIGALRDIAQTDFTGTGKAGTAKLGEKAVDIIAKRQKAAKNEYKAAVQEYGKAQQLLAKEQTPATEAVMKGAEARLQKAADAANLARSIGDPAALQPRLQQWADDAFAGKDAFQRQEFNSADLYGQKSAALRGQEGASSGVMQHLNAAREDKITGQRGAWKGQSDLSEFGRKGTAADRIAAQHLYDYTAHRAGMTDQYTGTGKTRPDAEQALQGQKFQREFANILDGFVENPAKAYSDLKAVERQALADNLAGKQTAGGRITPELAAKIGERLAIKHKELGEKIRKGSDLVGVLGAPFGMTTATAMAAKPLFSIAGWLADKRSPARGYGALKNVSDILAESDIKIKPKEALLEGGMLKGTGAASGAGIVGAAAGSRNADAKAAPLWPMQLKKEKEQPQMPQNDDKDSNNNGANNSQGGQNAFSGGTGRRLPPDAWDRLGAIADAMGAGAAYDNPGQAISAMRGFGRQQSALEQQLTSAGVPPRDAFVMSLTPDRANAYLAKRQGNTADTQNAIENQNTPNDNHWETKFRSRRELYDEYKGLGVADTALTHAEDLLNGMDDFGLRGIAWDKVKGAWTGQSPRAQQVASALNMALAQASNSEKFASGAENLNTAIQSGRRDEAMRIIQTLRDETAKRRKIVQDGYNNNRGELPDKL